VAPVAADVEDVHQRERGHPLHGVLEARLSGADGERGPVLLPRVAHETEAVVADGRGRGGGGRDRVPPFVLLDAERTLVEALADPRPGRRPPARGTRPGREARPPPWGGRGGRPRRAARPRTVSSAAASSSRQIVVRG